MVRVSCKEEERAKAADLFYSPSFPNKPVLRGRRHLVTSIMISLSGKRDPTSSGLADLVCTWELWEMWNSDGGDWPFYHALLQFPTFSPEHVTVETLLDPST